MHGMTLLICFKCAEESWNGLLLNNDVLTYFAMHWVTDKYVWVCGLWWLVEWDHQTEPFDQHSQWLLNLDVQFWKTNKQICYESSEPRSLMFASARLLSVFCGLCYTSMCLHWPLFLLYSLAAVQWYLLKGAVTFCTAAVLTVRYGERILLLRLLWKAC